MKPFNFRRLAATAAGVAVGAAALPVLAADQVIELNTLNASLTTLSPLGVNDSLTVDTTVLSAPTTASFLQVVTFTVGAGVTGIFGQAQWEVTTAAGPGPRVTGVDVNIFNATTNALVVTDTVLGTLGGFAISSIPTTAITPGNYRLEVSGTSAAGRGVVLDATISLVPEPGTYAMLLAGLGAVGFIARRRR